MASLKTIPVPVIGGIRLDQSDHMAPPGTLRDAVNVRFSAVGEIEARPGTNALPTTVAGADIDYPLIQNGVGLLQRCKGGFVLGSQGFGYRYDFGKGALQVAGSYSNAEPLGIFDTVTREQIDTATLATNVPAPLSQAAASGYVLTCYSCGNGQQGYGPGDNIAVAHVHTEDGTLVSSLAYPSTTLAMAVKDGSSRLALIRQDTTTNLQVLAFSLSAGDASIGLTASVGTLNANANFWAVCNVGSTGWAIVYQSGAAQLTVKTFSSSTQLNSVNFAITAASSPVSIYSDGAFIYVGWRDGAGAPYTASARVYTSALVLVTGTTTVTSDATTAIGPPLFGTGFNTGFSVTYAVSRGASSATNFNSWVEVGEFASDGTVSLLLKVYQCQAASAPFAIGYLWVRAAGLDVNTSTPFERSILLDFMQLRAGRTNVTTPTSWDPVIALTRELVIGAPGGAVATGWYQQFLHPPCQLSDGSYVSGIPRVVRTDGRGLALGEWLQFEIGGTRQSTRLGEDVLVAGWLTLATSEFGSRFIDGTVTQAYQRAGTDVGFPILPAVTVTTSNGAGSLTSSATYQWRTVIERIDIKGRRWRGPPSLVTTNTTGASDDTATVTVNCNTAWLRASGLRMGNPSWFVLHVYRTTANGSTFYRCTPPQGAPVSTADGFFTFTDLLADTAISVNEILYTDGGVLANDSPPSCRFVKATEDRVWLAGLWETEQLQSSKVLVPGEPPQFSDSPAFRVVLPEPCTGIAIQDGAVIAFARTSIYVIQGSGPNDQGQGAWDSPRCITRSTGCISPDSILETSVGIFFQSEEGIELLPRGLGEPQFVGMPVQDFMYSATLGGVTTVTSAAVVTTFRGRQARFVLDDGTNEPTVLVYDLDTQAWSRDDYPYSIKAIVDTESGAALALDGGTDYDALQEDMGEDRDDVGNSTGPAPSEVACSLEWSDLRPFGVASQGRLAGATALFDAKQSPSGGYRSGSATIKLTPDDHTETGFSWNMSGMSGASYRKVVPNIQECTSGTLSLTTTVGGWRFVGWTVEVDDLGGGRRMGEGEQG